MRRFKTISWLFLVWIALFIPVGFAQIPPPLPGAIPMATLSMTLGQSVNVSVQQINELSISGDVHLTISAATPGLGPDTVSDAVSSTYNITTNDAAKKIVASIDAAFSPGISLFVLLGQPSGAISTQQLLSTTSVDLVTGIGYLAETGLSISYTANVSIDAPPNGSGETRTVTLTLMDN
ncbi:MAG: hypothetical protein O3B41_03025 [Bacteroidetes bacterium]|nr:hypothetical protein [Bacteroidota bacterium]